MDLKGVREMVRKVRFRSESGYNLAGILHQPEAGKSRGVVIAHGFTGHKDANFIPELAKKLENEGYPVLRFDFSGNGESEGKFEDGTWTKFSLDLHSAIEFARQGMDVHNVAVVGFSMGGAVSIIEYVKFRDFDKLILIAPALKPATNRFLEMAWRQISNKGFVEFEDIKGRKWRLNRSYFEDREKYDLLKLGEQVDIPTLIIVGSKDDTVSIDAIKKFYHQVPSMRRLHVVDGENHVFHNTAKSFWSYIDEFLKQ